jgi:hypothetical protein
VGTPADPVRLLDGPFGCPVIPTWNPRLNAWNIEDGSGITHAKIGSTLGDFNTVLDALVAGCCFIRVVENVTDINLTMGVCEHVIVHVDPGVIWTINNNGGSIVIPAGGSFTIQGSGEKSVIVVASVSLFTGNDSSLLTIKDCSFTTFNTIVSPNVITRLQNALFVLANVSGCFIGTGIGDTIMDTQISNCIVIANAGGASADVIIGTVSSLNIDGLWLRGITTGIAINLTGGSTQLSNIYITSSWNITLSGIAVSLRGLTMDTTTETCNILVLCSNSTFSDISCTTFTVDGFGSINPPTLNTVSNCKFTNILSSGNMVVNRCQDSIFSGIRSANISVGSSTSGNTAIDRCQFSNIIIPGTITIGSTPVANQATLNDCDFSNIHANGTISICVASIDTATVICQRLQFSDISTANLILCQSTNSSIAQMLNSQFANLAITSTGFIARTLSATSSVTMTACGVDNVFYGGAISALSIGSIFAGSTWLHSNNKYNNLNIQGATPQLQLSTATQGLTNTFSNARINGNFSISNTRYNTWSNIEAGGFILIGSGTDHENFTNIVAFGVATISGVTNSNFVNIEGTTTIIGTNVLSITSCQFSNFQVTTLTINNTNASQLSNFYINGALNIGTTTSCVNCHFTDFQIATGSIYGSLASCVLAGHHLGQSGFVNTSIIFGVTGLQMIDCQLLNFRQLTSLGEAYVEIRNATRNRFTNCDFTSLSILPGISNDINMFENVMLRGNLFVLSSFNKFSNVNTIKTGTSTAFAITGATWLAGVATITSPGHAFSRGNLVIITGMNPAGYNGSYVIITVVAGVSFTISITVDPGIFVAGGSAVMAPFVGSAATDNQFSNVTISRGVLIAPTTQIDGPRTQFNNSRVSGSDHDMIVTGSNCVISNNIIGESGFAGNLTLPVTGIVTNNLAIAAGGFINANNSGAW